jgi:general stress protein YciG
MPFRTGGLRHETFEHQRDRKRDDAEKYAADPPKIQKIAQHGGEHRGAGERRQQRNQRKAVGCAKVERENAVGIA